MSDTPTNWEEAYRVQTERVEELRRENAALHAAIAAMPTCRCGLSTEEQCSLSVENADLRSLLREAIASLARHRAALAKEDKS